MLTNTLDGAEQVYRLLGTGQKPHPLDHILIECPAKQRWVFFVLTGVYIFSSVIRSKALVINRWN